MVYIGFMLCLIVFMAIMPFAVRAKNPLHTGLFSFIATLGLGGAIILGARYSFTLMLLSL